MKPPTNPLLIILGPTGTGKSLLSLRLASLFPVSPSHSGLEIINSDAPQLYRGLPIITNKLPLSERQGVPHHLLDFIELEEKPWNVQMYVREVDRVIQEVRGRGRLPVLVGGTGHYVHGTLFKDGLLARDAGEKGDRGSNEEDGEFDAVLNGSNEEIYRKLEELDPEMARRWHPNDRRKIQRSLEICLRTGRKASDIYEEQRKGDSVDGLQTEDGLRYDPLILWVDANDADLKTRLNARVDGMVEDGLFEEVIELAKKEEEYLRQGIRIEKDKGVWISIGYKEMEVWARNYLSNPSDAARDSELALACIEAVKAGTRQYAKRQNRYIRIRLANKLRQAGALDRLCLLDSSDLTRFEEDVVQPATELVKGWLSGSPLTNATSMSDFAVSTRAAINRRDDKQSYRFTRYCEVCDKTMVMEKEWLAHLSGRSHKNTVQRQRRIEQGVERGRAVASTRPDVDVPS